MNPSAPTRATMVALIVGISVVGGHLGAASPRETRNVQVVRQVQDAVVAIFSQEEKTTHTGSGSVIHPDGFILTNDHVVRNRPGLVLFNDGSVLPYRLVGRLPEKDLAIIQVSAKTPLIAIALGRSHDLLAGEPLLVAGNPGGRGIVFTGGMVSAPAIMKDAPSALVMSHFAGDVRDRFIQFDAAINPGNSGGPLINAEAQQIGVAAASIAKEENTGYAIPIDRARRTLAAMIAPEEVGGFWLGVEVDPLAGRAVVTAVATDSPAARAGISQGDVIVKSNGKPVGNGIDFTLLLVGGAAGRTFTLARERDGRIDDFSVVSASYPTPPGRSEEGMTAGLRYSLYPLDQPPRTLPDFAALKPARTGIAGQLAPRKLEPKLPSFGLVFEGFIRVRKEGVFRLIIRSDDGSRLILGGSIRIENDGPHPAQDASRVVRLGAGLHPVRVEYFEGVGESDLRLFLETLDGESTELTDADFFHQP